MNSMRTGSPHADADAWLVDLRARLVRVARRRVDPDAAEDVVQDAMRVIVERGVDRAGALGPGGEPGLAFSLRVLRNVIGNHYQKTRAEQRRRVPAEPDPDHADPSPDPLSALATRDALRTLRTCIDELRAADVACARYLTRLAEGYSPREVACDEGIDETALYRRVYRCRLKLRALLARRGIGV